MTGLLAKLNPILACSVCFKGDSSNSKILGVQLGILVMFVFLLIIFICLGKFAFDIKKRSELLTKNP